MHIVAAIITATFRPKQQRNVLGAEVTIISARLDIFLLPVQGEILCKARACVAASSGGFFSQANASRAFESCQVPRSLVEVSRG